MLPMISPVFNNKIWNSCTPKETNNYLLLLKFVRKKLITFIYKICMYTCTCILRRYDLVKIFVIDKNAKITGFKILTVLKVLAYPKIKKIKYNKRYIKILLAQQECIFPEWPLQQHWNSQSELYTDSWIQRANSGPQN